MPNKGTNVPEDLDKLVKDAKKAYRRGQRRKGAALLDQVLNLDFMYEGAWQALYEEYGANRPFAAFQLKFAQKYYPDKVHLLPQSTGPSRQETVGQPVTGTLPLTESQRPTGARQSPDQSEEIIRVMIVDDIAQARENIIRSLQFQPSIDIVATASNGMQAIELARATEPDVVLMDVNMPDMDGITATSGVKKVVPFTQVIILTVQDDVDYMRKAMLAGARDFLTKPPMIDELIQAVEGAAEIAHREKVKVAQSARFAKLGTPASTIFGRIITIYSPKGGTGTTTIASNLAVALCNDETRVVLVDANLLYGDIAIMFNEHSKNSVADLTARADELDAEVVEDVLITHNSGVKILAAPRPELADDVNPRQFSTMLEYLRRIFTYVIVDTSSKLSDVTLAALDVSDLLILITGQEIPTIARTHKFLELLPLLNFDPKRLVVVMNQYDRRINIKPEKVGESFHREIAVVLPRQNSIVQPSVNRGIPFMINRNTKTQPVGQAILKLASVMRQRISEMADTHEVVR